MEKCTILQDPQHVVNVDANLTDSFDIYSRVKHDRMLFRIYHICQRLGDDGNKKGWKLKNPMNTSLYPVRPRQ